jgi:hypothetical protein
MNRNELASWLDNQKLTIENIILEAAQQFVKEHQQQPNFGYDLKCAQEEAYNLGDGKDLCYDRLTTPLAYSLWYQARRINVFLSHYLDKVIEACVAGRPVEIFDLGAGTGCVQFCFGLAAVACMRLKKSFPLLRVINVDSSPFMLDYLQKHLWPAAVRHFPELSKMAVEYHVYSWSNKGDLSIANPWICASYLFDSSDNEAYLVSNFNELIGAFEPEKILMLSSRQENKKRLMNALSQKLKEKKYQSFTLNDPANVFTGTLQQVNNFRQGLVSKYSLKASSYPVSWSDKSFTAIGLERKQSGFSFDVRRKPEVLDIFNPPLRIRRDVALNEDQKRAAQFETRPSIITGPAGCGKSIVVTEKIINILEHYKWQGPLRILVTTFNISLLKQLRGWITDLISAKGKGIHQHYYRLTNNENDGTGKLSTGDNLSIVIEFTHFEMLGKYVGKIKFLPYDEEVHVQKLAAIVTEVRQELNIPDRNMKNILTPNFLLEEYHRIIYGMQCRINLGEQVYLDIDRTGRGKGLDRTAQRPAIWRSLRKYAIWMNTDKNAGQSFMARRQLLYNGLKDGTIDTKFDHVFVDEFQDCTKTDFEIMNMLLHNTNNLVLAGDLAQAVHIGKSGFIPKDADSGNRKRHPLKGSYRLPFRICEAIYPLSKQINKVSINKDETPEITPYKGAPPGARPIVVCASDSTGLAKKIQAIKAAYSVFDLKRVTIMEKDDELCRAIRQFGIPVETTTILRLKGLEKEFIVWSLQADIEYEDEVLEFAYTIMTRTNCMLVIALSNKAREIYLPVLNYLEKERLIFWDDESASQFSARKSNASIAVV